MEGLTKNTVICGIVKNEQLFIREWVEHYLKIGFDKLYIYEDFGSRSHLKEIKDYVRKGQVELISLDKSHVIPHFKRGTQVQGHLYSRFLEWCRSGKIKADWIGFFDVDEFMMFEEGWDLEKLEEEFADCGGVLLSWKLYGANGHLNRPKGSVVTSYTTHLPEGTTLDSGAKDWNVKSLVNVAKCDGKRHIHVFNGCQFTDHQSFDGGFLVFEKAWLNHYYTKSWEDYLDRIFARGNMQNNYRCLDKFFKVNPDMLSRKEEMVEAQRYRHPAGTMWISRDLKILSGGNEGIIKKLNTSMRL